MPGPITHIATADATSVTVRGRDLVNDLIGKHTFTEVFYFLVTGRMPDAAQARVLDACLVTLDGARLYAVRSDRADDGRERSRPDPGVDRRRPHGDRQRARRHHGGLRRPAGGRRQTRPMPTAGAAASSRSTGSARRRCPASGTRCTSRTTRGRRRSCAWPGRTDWTGATCSFCSSCPQPSTKRPAATSPSMPPARSRRLLLEIGIPAEIVRAIAVVSRSAGLVGHILEEQQTDSSRHLVKLARETIPYRDPPSSFD